MNAPAWICLAAVALAGCAPEPEPPGPDVVARIGGQDVARADFEDHVRRNAGDGGEVLASEALSTLLDQFLTERLLVHMAAERGWTGADAGSSSAAEALLAHEPRAAPSEAEIAAWFEAHRAEHARPERVEVAQILVADRVSAERARRELVAGADFAEIARRVSLDPAAAGGGQQGIFAREDLPPAFAAIIFALPEGGISEVVAADYGFHVFRVVRRLPAEEPSLDRARAEILARLETERADRALARLVAEATGRYAVEVYDHNLPFAYEGAFPVSRPYENR